MEMEIDRDGVQEAVKFDSTTTLSFA